MTRPAVAPYGAWESPITAAMVAAGGVRLSEIHVDGADLWWAEGRPSEGGRAVVVRRTPDGAAEDVPPPPYSARSRVHEYGGGALLPHRGALFFVNFDDQRLYRQEPGGAPRPVTPPLPMRYADMAFDERRDRLVCVCEHHGGGEPKNFLASIPAQGGHPAPLHEGRDFYHSPRLSPDGAQLAWLAWDHPHMPWDAAELWLADVTPDGALRGARMVAGGPGDSCVQPAWSPDGALHVIAERSGWWNLYRLRGDALEPLCPMAAEFGEPLWAFGGSRYAFDGLGRIVCVYTQGGAEHLAALDTATGALTDIATPYVAIDALRVQDGAAIFIGSTPTEAAAVVRLPLTPHPPCPPGEGEGAAAPGVRGEVLRRSSAVAPDAGYLSTAQQVEFPTAGGRTAFGFFYAPRNQDYAAPEGERPPLLVMSHGGPTGATGAGLSLKVQYWTSRGFAVLDVNYGGSTGFGRAYRERLDGQWGVVDVDDCCAGARWLAERGLVDGARMAITGGSAGGYTTLAALTFRDVFAAGASHYGIGDLEVFVTDTHKFESRYLERLVGPYPERLERYRARSPLYHVDALARPVIFFQGLDDAIVPPNQAEQMVAALRAKGLPVEYVAFPGEGHGFRRAENIVRALEDELAFYQRHLLT